MRKTVVLISGPSGIGKTTLRLLLRNELGKYYNNKIAGIDIDNIYGFIDPSFVAPDYLEIWKKARQNTGTLANGFLNSDIDVVFIFGNTIFRKDQVDDVLSNIKSDVVTHHITLYANRDTLAERLKKRQYAVPRWITEHLAEREPFLNEPWTTFNDKSNHSPERTLQIIHQIIKNKS